MTDKSEITTPGKPSPQLRQESEWAMKPLIDVFEDDTGLTLHADMPGVSRQGLDITVDSDTLTLEGKADIAMTEGMTPLYADVRSNRYRRSFALSRELDTEHIEATLRDGVLILRIPKLKQYQPRRIEIRAG
ncbi:MAG: heat-shock protein [Candidatus Sedimenticola endophacoides]|uniref:Heat-shock protein n=1 Tax=Candidatus Sedimenticola endophacoides TaxID=2548426 RepID=A0A6N4DHZ7_9GAMM|nr:MAG: heat-shock protein [Candidatus Sedimenticola endophacoides]OQX38103.1 MAG: heat-shock protein [Candidatus Sedimenticola endophacoides]OQX38835.1 MAG: heat-shock protein [Candidatus Sedimenticola endophacoides]OQX44674.1 MAG: heat-shock protein [Candidatus Sedimenticola endophacoides]PUD98010.1 MAG: heat-shock protein [Candidatus Sedimenticola endophacoides]